jgi:hypothetical protein
MILLTGTLELLYSLILIVVALATFVLHAELKNDVCLRGSTHKSGTSVLFFIRNNVNYQSNRSKKIINGDRKHDTIINK